MLRALLPFLCILGLAGQACGQVTKLTIRPQVEPTPAMKYRLLPEVRDQGPGNAALLYQRAHSPEWLGNARRSPDYQKIVDWLELPLKDLPKDKVRGLLPKHSLLEVDQGARRQHCDWQMLERFRKDGFMMLMADIQVFREFGTLLALRARLEMLEGKFDKATYTLETGFALARHLDEAPTLISGLVGIAIANNMCNQMEAMIQLPDAPSFYWALTDLPRPFISLRTGYQSEKMAVDSLFPEMRAALDNPKMGPLSMAQLHVGLDNLFLLTGDDKGGMRLGAAVLAAMNYPEAKRSLIKRGRTPAQVDALPVLQVALMHALAQYDKHFDNFYKWQNLPSWEAQAGLNKAIHQLKESKSKVLVTGGIPLAELLIPAVMNVLSARARLDRRIAALRCIEAIRLYAADNDGKLPASLSDIKQVPIPIDPFTGKNFEYRLENGKATLLGRPLQGHPATERDTIHYELTLATSAKEQQ